MDDQTPPNTTQPSASSKKSRLNKQTALVLIVVVLALLGAGWVLYKNNQKGSDSLDTNTYSFQNTQQVVVKGTSSGKGMSFLRPEEYKSSVAESTNNKEVFVRLQEASNKQYFSTGMLMGRVQDFNKDGPTPESAQTLKQNFNNPSSESYKTAIKTVETTVKNLYNDATVENLGTATAFTNQNITKDAWKFDFTAKGQNGAPDQQGTVVFAIGQKGLYYYVVSAKSSDWQNNQSFFNNLLSSIQIDI